MRPILAVVSICLLLAGCGSPGAAPTPGADRFGDVRERIEQLVAGGEVPSMAVAVARDGAIVWEEGFGLADREKNTPATEHTMYPLASISKPFAATALMILVERGLIDLESPINDYLGEAKLQARVGDAAEATVYRVASHTAGLPLHSQHYYDDEVSRPRSMKETIERYGILVTAPGERYQYSNIGYGVLDHVISRVSGRSYADFLREELFVPLGMNHTTVHVGPGLEEGQAVKYAPDGSEVPPCESDCPAAGSIYASAHDLIRFAMFHLKNELPPEGDPHPEGHPPPEGDSRSDQKPIISDAAIDAMQRPSPETYPLREWEREGSGYGIGWYIGFTAEGLGAVYHNGGTHGVSTVLALVPEENLAVAVLTNTSSPWPDAILIEVLQTLLPGKFQDVAAPAGGAAGEPPFAPGPELAGAWEGLVHTFEGGIPLLLEIEDSGGVRATLGDQRPAHLQSVSYREDYAKFNNAGGGPFLRGWMMCDLGTEDVNRGRPYTLWLELKLRDNVLNGSLIALSQRPNPTGPLAHWVELRRK